MSLGTFWAILGRPLGDFATKNIWSPCFLALKCLDVNSKCEFIEAFSFG
jgi:hypothetical protein